jgi:Fe-Mn family superoxide dismutase
MPAMAAAKKSATFWSPFEDTQVAPFSLPPLPYDEGALAPVISAATLNVHHGAHHKAYIDKTNKLVEEKGLQGKTLIEVVRTAFADKAKPGLFNNSAQAWNHTFYWHSMTKGGGGQPQGALKEALERDFGGFDGFKEKFSKAAAEQFGSGWAWLVADGSKLKIMATGNADTPIVHNVKPLLTIDVWEHAYYLDYKNKRPDYIAAWLDKLANWSFASDNFTQAAKK